MSRILIIAAILVILAGGAACYFYRDKFSEPPKQTAIKPKHNKPFSPDIVMTVGDKKFDVRLADNETTRALFTQLPFTVKMEDHLANEKIRRLAGRFASKSHETQTSRDRRHYAIRRTNDCLVL